EAVSRRRQRRSGQRSGNGDGVFGVAVSAEVDSEPARRWCGRRRDSLPGFRDVQRALGALAGSLFRMDNSCSGGRSFAVGDGSVTWTTAWRITWTTARLIFSYLQPFQ